MNTKNTSQRNKPGASAQSEEPKTSSFAKSNGTDKTKTPAEDKNEAIRTLNLANFKKAKPFKILF